MTEEPAAPSRTGLEPYEVYAIKYEHMETGRVFPTAFHVGEMVEGYDRLGALAQSPRHIIPGHDPLVMERYPAPIPALEGNRGPARRAAKVTAYSPANPSNLAGACHKTVC